MVFKCSSHLSYFVMRLGSYFLQKSGCIVSHLGETDVLRSTCAAVLLAFNCFFLRQRLCMTQANLQLAVLLPKLSVC